MGKVRIAVHLSPETFQALKAVTSALPKRRYVAIGQTDEREYLCWSSSWGEKARPGA